MSNMVAEIFRIEKSPTLEASLSAFLSVLKWTKKAGAMQDSLKRALSVWFLRAQKPAKIMGKDDAIIEMDIEEIEPMLSERIVKWQEEFKAEGRAEGRVEAQKSERKRMAKEMLVAGIPVSTIAQITELTEEEVKRLQDTPAQ